jgi:molecular chaperone DnaK (HSP70)
VAAWFLRGVIKSLRESGRSTDALVVAVPVQSFESYSHWLSQVLADAGVKELRVVDESTAAAIGYGIQELGGLVDVVDFGGGSLDVSRVRIPRIGRSSPVGWRFVLGRIGALLRTKTGSGDDENDIVAREIGKDGWQRGGDDVDEWVVDDFLAIQSPPVARGEIAEVWTQLRNSAEDVKKRLSRPEYAERPADFSVFWDSSGRIISGAYSRAKLEATMERNLVYQRLQEALDNVESQGRAKGLGRNEIEKALLVGGMCLVPSIQRQVRTVYGEARVVLHDPFQAVARGAVLLARDDVRPDFILLHSYGLRHRHSRTGAYEYEELFGSGTSYPTSTSVAHTWACSEDGWDCLNVVIAELAWTGRDTRRRLEAAVPLNDHAPTIVRLQPPGKKGVPRVRAEFAVDRNRRLRLTVYDLYRPGRPLLENQVVTELK